MFVLSGEGVTIHLPIPSDRARSCAAPGTDSNPRASFDFERLAIVGGARLAELQNAAEAGDSGAMYRLGVQLYRRAKFRQARSWFEKAAKAGSSAAMVEIAMHYWRRSHFRVGRSKEELHMLARPWLERATTVGNAEAMWLLGLECMRVGNRDGARKWWTQAAERGHRASQKALERGQAIPTPRMARTWWRDQSPGD